MGARARDIETKEMVIDLERKLLIFLEQPHFKLNERLRPMLSHDDKRLVYKITDKSKSGSLRTKTAVIVGYSTFLFCTAKMDMDEQERTRAILLSPESSQEKIRQTLDLIGQKEGEPDVYREKIKTDPRRYLLTQRIKDIKDAEIVGVKVKDSQAKVVDRFREGRENLSPRHQRDLPKLFSLIKGCALLNFHKREKEESQFLGKLIGKPIIIYASQKDIDDGFLLYGHIAESNELGIQPENWDLYQIVIKPLLDDNSPVEINHIMNKYYSVYGRPINPLRLKNEILPMIESVGLIIKDKDPHDHRRSVFYPPGYSVKSKKWNDGQKKRERPTLVPNVLNSPNGDVELFCPRCQQTGNYLKTGGWEIHLRQFHNGERFEPQPSRWLRDTNSHFEHLGGNEDDLLNAVGDESLRAMSRLEQLDVWS